MIPTDLFEIPRFIIEDFLGSVTRSDLEAFQMVRKSLGKVITTAGQRLPQRRLIYLEDFIELAEDRDHGQYHVEFFIAERYNRDVEKRIKLVEGKVLENAKVVENCVVEFIMVFGDIEKSFVKKIYDLIGEKRLPVYILEKQAKLHQIYHTNEDLEQFRNGFPS